MSTAEIITRGILKIALNFSPTLVLIAVGIVRSLIKEHLS